MPIFLQGGVWSGLFARGRPYFLAVSGTLRDLDETLHSAPVDRWRLSTVRAGRGASFRFKNLVTKLDRTRIDRVRLGQPVRTSDHLGRLRFGNPLPRLRRRQATAVAVTHIQRFGSTADLSIHPHYSVLNGFYRNNGRRRAPTGSRSRRDGAEGAEAVNPGEPRQIIYAGCG